jgi:hypothetical protein
MKLKLTRLIPSTALFCLLVASCKKEDAVSVSTPSSTLSTQNARVTSMIGAMSEASDQEALDMYTDESAGITGKAASACPEVTYSPSSTAYPRTVTFDYGTGCTDALGRNIKGVRTVVQKENFRTAHANSVLSLVTYSNYYIGNTNISGNATNVVLKAGTPGPYVFRTIYKRTITDGSGNTSTFIGQSTHTQVIGDINSKGKDAGYSNNETDLGVESTPGQPTVAWTLITSKLNPIIKLGSCAPRVAGQVHICLVSLHDKTTEDVDFGNGDCDNQATLSVNGGAPTTVTLPFNFFAVH